MNSFDEIKLWIIDGSKYGATTFDKLAFSITTTHTSVKNTTFNMHDSQHNHNQHNDTRRKYKNMTLTITTLTIM